MYKTHWGLNARPFDHRADGAFYYPAQGHQAALVKLRYALEQGSAALLAGGTGTGKTLLLESLTRQLADRGNVFVRVAYSRMSPGELLAYLADELSEQIVLPHGTGQPVDQCLRRIEAALKRLTSQQKRLVIAIDDAQSINNADTFEALRLLLNLAGPERNPPALVLVGQTQLLATVSRMPAFDELFAAKCLLPALSTEETAAYITHRLQAAGRTSELFDGSATEAVHARTHGAPRRINRLCDLALMVGYAEERQAVSAELIDAIAEELVGSTPRSHALRGNAA
jgi:general secretion pathway protein A